MINFIFLKNLFSIIINKFFKEKNWYIYFWLKWDNSIIFGDQKYNKKILLFETYFFNNKI